VWKPYAEQQEVLVFKFNLKGNSGYYLLNLILPIWVLGILNLFVFLLPPESGERVAYSITVLLSIVVFLTITSNSLPGTSEPRMPTIFLLLTGYVVMSVLIVYRCNNWLEGLSQRPGNAGVSKLEKSDSI
jgi:hypothetical protein